MQLSKSEGAEPDRAEGKKKGSLQLVQEKSDVRDVKTREKRCQVALAFDSTSCSNTNHQSPSTVGLDIHAQ